jgi:EAL domain-containing protein (putative c-di-GMP-specific phosphodiesterase class I)
LRESIQQRQFELWLQPKVNHLGEISGFEALIRWPQLDEIIMPDAFIPLAERLGLIPAISRQVLERAVELLKDWRRVNASYSLAINLAGAELQDEEFFHELVMLSKESPWLVEKLELEITETHLTMLNPYVNKRLHELKQLGYRLAIDDFGTGHASLAQLIDIPADAIKLDKRFIDKLTSDAQHIKIVYTTLSLAQSLNVELVAEGVENELQYQYLVDMGCQMMQGYYFSRPRPAGEWLDHIIAAEGQAINMMREPESALLVD